MSKIICDVCGTSYSETATHCPICGCVRPGDAVTVAGDTNVVETPVSGTYNYVKGGRFSKANVRKRNNGGTLKTVAPKAKQDAGAAPKKNEKALIAVVALLLIAIVAIAIFIAVRFFTLGGQGKQDPVATETTSVATTTEETETTVLEVPCEELLLSNSLITFDQANAAVLLSATPSPADTTDVITFIAEDETVVTVNDQGKIVAVGPGETIITVICGDATAECTVICTFEDPNQETTVETYPTEELKFNREDFTMSRNGDTWKLYTGEIPADLITWTSDDEKVATIKDGVVTAVGGGYTTVYGEYLDAKVSCIVRCSGPKYTEPAVEEETTTNSNYTISATDVTISVNETFTLTVSDKDGNAVEVSWASADTEIASVSGNVVTGVASGKKTVVTTTHDGVTLSCIVRVK